MARLELFFPGSLGKPRVDNLRVLSGIIFVKRNDLRWRNSPREYGPDKTLHNLWKRWSAAGIFRRLLDGLAAGMADHQTIMMDAPYLKAPRTASILRVKKGCRSPDRADQRRYKQEAARGDGQEWPLDQALHDDRRVQRLYWGRCPARRCARCKIALADRGYDADWFRNRLEEKGIRPCIPGRRSRTTSVSYDKRKYRRRNRIEIMFGRRKDWRRIATRHDKCPTVFSVAIRLAATVILWLRVPEPKQTNLLRGSES